MANDIKEAQDRSMLNRLRPSNITRQVAKINPTYRALYDKLKEADDYIREISGPEGESVKDLIGGWIFKGELQKNVRSQRWIPVLDTAAKINNIAKDIHSNALVRDFIGSMDESVKEFYFTEEGTGGKPVDMSNIHSIVSKKQEVLIAEALFGDLSRKVTDTFLSSFYDKKTKEMKMAMNNLANRAESLGNRILQTYKELDAQRAKGNIGQYINSLNTLKKEQEKFEDTYKKTYALVKDYLPQEKERTESGIELEDVKTEVNQEQPVNQEIPLDNTFTPQYEFGPQGLEVPDSAIEIQPDPIEIKREQGIVNWDENLPKPQQENTTKPSQRAQSSQAQEFGRQSLWESPEVAAAMESVHVAIKNGDKRTAVGILLKCSHELEQHGDIENSIKAMLLAEDIINA